MASANQRDLVGGGIKLLLFGAVLYALINIVIWKQIELIYPYITYEMVDALNLWLILCFAIPSIFLIGLAYFGKYFDPECETSIPSLVKILFLVSGLLACGSILGIRTGVAIFMNLKKQGKPPEDSKEIMSGKNTFKAYRLYLVASGWYLLVFGLFFLALINFLLVITLPLLYPTVTQPLMIGLEIWFWLCLIIPAILYLVMAVVIKPMGSTKQLEIQKKILSFGSILAIFSVFGFSAGMNLIKSQWMLEPPEK